MSQKQYLRRQTVPGHMTETGHLDRKDKTKAKTTLAPKIRIPVLSPNRVLREWTCFIKPSWQETSGCTLSISVEAMWLQEEAAVRTGCGGEGLFIPSCLRFPVLLVSFKILLCLYLFQCAFPEPWVKCSLPASSTRHVALPP